MLMDAQRAIRYARTLAAGMRLRTDHLGVMGFSAGGHLASTTGTHVEDEDARPKTPDLIDQQNARPDFLILCYPVISMIEPFAHQTSRKNLLGETPDPKLVEWMSNERRVTSGTPPTFLFQTDDDQTVAPENAAAFYLALKRAGVPAELHIYQHGKHGVGMALGDPVLKSWPDRLADWLRVRELIP
jgi:acetyl esterase/lipase